MTTFIKLKDGYWGVKVDGDDLTRLDLSPRTNVAGLRATAVKRDGTTKEVVLVAPVRVDTRRGFAVFSIEETRKASAYRPSSRGYQRASGEQASRASQSAPYDLAPAPMQANDLTMTRVNEVQRATAWTRDYYTAAPAEPVAEVQAKLESTSADDLAALFSQLLAQPSNLDPESKLLR